MSNSFAFVRFPVRVLFARNWTDSTLVEYPFLCPTLCLSLSLSLYFEHFHSHSYYSTSCKTRTIRALPLESVFLTWVKRSKSGVQSWVYWKYTWSLGFKRLNRSNLDHRGQIFLCMLLYTERTWVRMERGSCRSRLMKDLHKRHNCIYILPFSDSPSKIGWRFGCLNLRSPGGCVRRWIFHQGITAGMTRWMTRQKDPYMHNILALYPLWTLQLSLQLSPLDVVKEWSPDQISSSPYLSLSG